MTAVALMHDLARLGIRLEAHSGKLRYHPRSQVPAELAGRMRVHRSELMEILRAEAPVDEMPDGHLAHDLRDLHGGVLHGQHELTVCRCGSDRYRDVPIHAGQSVRRDCARCGRFLDFPKWYESTNGRTGWPTIASKDGA